MGRPSLYTKTNDLAALFSQPYPYLLFLLQNLLKKQGQTAPIKKVKLAIPQRAPTKTFESVITYPDLRQNLTWRISRSSNSPIDWARCIFRFRSRSSFRTSAWETSLKKEGTSETLACSTLFSLGNQIREYKIYKVKHLSPAWVLLPHTLPKLI